MEIIHRTVACKEKWEESLWIESEYFSGITL
jgi:hypothetical protein